jgi:diacylglycerol kinase (ATP)
MRAAVIFGLGTSPADLKPFQANSPTEWLQGLPAYSSRCRCHPDLSAETARFIGISQTLVRLQLPVLVVPAGSGNDFARALQLRSPRDSLQAWRDFESGKIQSRPVDLGVIIESAAPQRTHYFCSVAGCGLDTVVTRRANRMPRWLRGHGGYALALLPLLLKLPAFSMRLTQVNGTGTGTGDDADEDRSKAQKPTLLAAFANTQFYGDGMRIAPQADFADGKLDICRINQLNSLRLLVYVSNRLFRASHLVSPESRVFASGEEFMVQTETPLAIYADGEFVCETPAEISVAAGALRVIHAARG